MVAQAQPLSGFFVTDALSALFAAAQLGSQYAASIVSIGLNLLQFVIDSYIEPRAAGTAVSISPFNGAVCRIPLGWALGDSRRLYRRADPDRARNGLSGILGPPDRSWFGWMGLDAEENRRMTDSLWLRTDRCAR